MRVDLATEAVAFTYAKHRDRNPQAGIWANHACRCVVASTAPGLSWIIDFYHLFHVGSLPGNKLFFWQLHFAVLFAGNCWRFTSQLVWTETCLVAGLADFFSRAAGTMGAWGISGDLLLLPRRILQSVLG